MIALSGLLSALGLSAAAGLNAYIPLLVVGLLARYTNLIQLSAPYDLLTNPWVLLVLALITLADMIGDKIPAIDHILHLAGLVIQPVAGAILALAATSAVGNVDPALAAICGLVTALGIHGIRATARPVATATTGGIANPVISVAEDGASLTLSLLASIVPVVAFLLTVAMVVLLILGVRRLFRRREAQRL
jgi:hypothetical protein